MPDQLEEFRRSEKLKQHKLKAIPPDVYDILLDEQKEKKKQCHCQYSIEQTIYMLIRRAAKKPSE